MKTILKIFAKSMKIIQRFVIYIGLLVIALFVAVGDRD